jgi:hypothetical protein
LNSTTTAFKLLKSLKNNLTVLYLAFGLAAFTSCSKPSELGLSLVETDPSDIIYNDTTSLKMITVLTEPLKTDKRSRYLCGSYIDPIFGKSSSEIFMNFRLTTTNARFPSATLDSLVLMLQYDSIGHYGGDFDNLGQQTWEVYRLNEAITQNQDYYSNSTFALGDLLATHSFTPNIYDSVNVGGTNRKAHLRIRIDNDLGLELLSPDSAIYENNNVFKSALKGFCIKPKANVNNSAIIRFLPATSLTKLTMYYKDSSGVARTYEFLNDADAESVLSMQHNYNGTRVLLNSPLDTVSYVQGMNGVSTRIEFPFLDSLGKIIVNKAELYFYAAGEEDRNFPIPNQLFCLEKTSDDKYLLIDDVTNSINRSGLNPYLIFGGTLTKDGDIRYYRMNISQFFQKLVDNRIDERALYIQTASVTDTARMLLVNEKGTALKAKLYLTYTKIN